MKKCYAPIGKKEKLCARHQAEKEDKVKKVTVQAGGIVLSAGAVVLTKGKDIAKYM